MHNRRSFKRTDRIGDELQKELSSLIRDSVKDPRLTGLVTISGVKVSKDLSVADVRFTVMQASDVQENSFDAHGAEAVLNGASGFLRNELSQLIRLRIMPRLRFHYDQQFAQGSRLSALIEQVTRREEQLSGGDVPGSGVKGSDVKGSDVKGSDAKDNHVAGSARFVDGGDEV